MNNDDILLNVIKSGTDCKKFHCQLQMSLIYFIDIFLSSNAVNISDTLTYVRSFT